ncbi:MAG TPA: FxsA family protein [Polyangiaceae bacterium]|nr:FxsA family protein [Polyangiaceae bacterium]
MRFLPIAFILIPLIELYLLIGIGSRIGIWPTVAFTMLTGLAGTLLARREGRRVWRAWRSALTAGRTPEAGVVEGVLVLVGGALLIAPGVLTDVAGLLLLIPPSRRWAARRLRLSLDRHVARLQTRGVHPGRSPRVVETRGESLD